MNSSRTYESIQLAQKYVIGEYLSFNVLTLKLAWRDAVTQNFHFICKFETGCPYDACFKPTVGYY